MRGLWGVAAPPVPAAEPRSPSSSSPGASSCRRPWLTPLAPPPPSSGPQMERRSRRPGPTRAPRARTTRRSGWACCVPWVCWTARARGPTPLMPSPAAQQAGDAAPVAAAAVAALSLAAACLHRGPMPLPPLAAAPRYAPQSGSGSSRCRGWGRACRRAAASRSVPGPCCPTALMCWCVPWAAGGWGQRASGSELVEKAAVAAWQRRGGAGEAADARRAAWLVPPSLVPPPSPPPHPPLPCNHPPPNQPACR